MHILITTKYANINCWQKDEHKHSKTFYINNDVHPAAWFARMTTPLQMTTANDYSSEDDQWASDHRGWSEASDHWGWPVIKWPLRMTSEQMTTQDDQWTADLEASSRCGPEHPFHHTVTDQMEVLHCIQWSVAFHASSSSHPLTDQPNDWQLSWSQETLDSLNEWTCHSEENKKTRSIHGKIRHPPHSWENKKAHTIHE